MRRSDDLAGQDTADSRGGAVAPGSAGGGIKAAAVVAALDSSGSLKVQLTPAASPSKVREVVLRVGWPAAIMFERVNKGRGRFRSDPGAFELVRVLCSVCWGLSRLSCVSLWLPPSPGSIVGHRVSFSPLSIDHRSQG